MASFSLRVKNRYQAISGFMADVFAAAIGRYADQPLWQPTPSTASLLSLKWLTQSIWKISRHILMTPVFIAKGMANLTIVPALTGLTLIFPPTRIRINQPLTELEKNIKPQFIASRFINYFSKTPILIGVPLYWFAGLSVPISFIAAPLLFLVVENIAIKALQKIFPRLSEHNAFQIVNFPKKFDHGRHVYLCQCIQFPSLGNGCLSINPYYGGSDNRCSVLCMV